MTVGDVSLFQVHVHSVEVWISEWNQFILLPFLKELLRWIAVEIDLKWFALHYHPGRTRCTRVGIWKGRHVDAGLKQQIQGKMGARRKPALALFTCDQITREQLVYKTEEHSWIIQCIYCIISICDFEMSIIFKTKASLKCQVHILSKLGNITKSNLPPANVIALRKISVSQMQPKWH